jgi:hypothetical protein
MRGQALSLPSAQAGFEATGLLPFRPERVLSSLVVVRTPSSPQTAANSGATWTAETLTQETSFHIRLDFYVTYYVDNPTAQQVKLYARLSRTVSLLSSQPQLLLRRMQSYVLLTTAKDKNVNNADSVCIPTRCMLQVQQGLGLVRKADDCGYTWKAAKKENSEKSPVLKAQADRLRRKACVGSSYQQNWR